MSWEWVAPVATASAGAAGVFFTWLAGHQGRKHVSELARKAEEKENRDRILKERRDAYLGALRLLQGRQSLDGQFDLDAMERAKLAGEVNASIAAFGSTEARDCLRRWLDAGDNEHALQSACEDFLRIARSELAESPEVIN